MGQATSRDLAPLFAPRSVAVVGASNDPAKWGQWLARGALAGEHRRAVYLVTRSGAEVLGRSTYRSLEELPEAPELVVLAVPASVLEQAADAALAAGARAIVAIAAGLGETGAEGRAREEALAACVRAAGALLLGPNCMGVYDAESELDLSSAGFCPGPISLVSQSGNLAIETGILAGEAGLGVARFASIGNQADLGAAELLRSLAEHVPTRLIGVYCEDFRDGRELARAALAAVEAGKAVVLLAGGTSEAGVQAARSHTGALASGPEAVDAACRAAGIVRVSTPRELVGVAQILLARNRPHGTRVAVVTDGGGSAVVAADVASESGLELPRLSPALSGRLAAVMPPTATTTNPVDFAGGGEQDLRSYERVPRLLLESDEVDCVLLTGYLGGYSATSPELRGAETEAALGLARAADETGKAVVVQTMYWQGAPAQALRAEGVPVLRDVGDAVRALACAARQATRAPWGVPELPPPAPAVSVGDYLDARALIAAAGIDFPDARRARTADEALAAAAELGYPVVLKAVGVLHKSEAGGVVVGIEDETALGDTFETMTRGVAPESFAVERMVRAPGLELIVGCRRDARFGPVLLVGLGGIFVEVLRDTAAALAPAAPDQVEALLAELRGADALAGVRGGPALAVGAAAQAAAAVSRLAAAHPEIQEVEINPLLVTADGALALDARVLYSQPR